MVRVRVRVRVTECGECGDCGDRFSWYAGCSGSKAVVRQW